MLTIRSAQACGKADYGWLQARYSFSFGHYFDPGLMGFASLRVLNQEDLAPCAAFQPRTYPNVDVLNLILDGEAEYRDSEGNEHRVRAGEAMLIAAQQGVSYTEQNISQRSHLSRLQLWLDACPQHETARFQKITLQPRHPLQLIASPDGASGSLKLRQQVSIYQLRLKPGQQQQLRLQASRTYIQSVHGAMTITSDSPETVTLACGDGAFVQEEKSISVTARTPLWALIIDIQQ